MKSFLLSTLIAAGTALSLQAQEDTLSFAAPQRLNSNVNSEAEESFPILSPDGETLYFTRTYHPGNTGGKFGGQGIWLSRKKEGSYTQADKIRELNDRSNNVVTGIAKDGERLYVLNRRGDKNTLMPGVSRSERNAVTKKWEDAESVSIPGLVVEGNFYSAYVSPDEDFILWTLPRRGTDTTNNIFVSLSDDAGATWTAPKDLGPAINSGGDDISPFFDKKSGLLFWSTNGREGFGDYDIFYSRKLDESWEKWSEPVNAGKEINSTRFDAYFYIAADSSALFSSNRGDSLSNLYISEVIITLPAEEEEEEKDADEDALAGNGGAGEGTGSDNGTGEGLADKDPVLIVETKGQGSRSDRSLKDLTREELLDSETRIRFVYFPYNKYNITAKYIEVLDDVGELLDTYQDLHVVIDGHTDHVGSQAFNMVLSENRALSTKEYLLIHGVEDDRIKTRAFGKLKPYSTNDTDEGRALNRRVEMRFKTK